MSTAVLEPKADVQSVGHFIGGEWQSAKDAYDHHDPGRLNEVVVRLARGTPEDVAQAVRAAHAAFPAWRDMSPAERAQLMMVATEAMSATAEELAPLMVREHGGMLWEAQTDFGLGAGVTQHTLSLVEDFFKPTIIDEDAAKIMIERMPRGVCVGIIPWNMPLVLAMMKIAPALATGNTMVIKPSPFAAGARTRALAAVAAKLPAGVLNVVLGEGDVGAALISHPLVRKVGFTGGTETAKHVMTGAAQGIKNVTLELGGNDPAVMLDDADLEMTLERMLKGIYTRSGQICFAVKRVYVPKNRYQEFTDALVERVSKYTVGHGLSDGVDFGPLNNKAQYEKVLGFIAGADSDGARVLELGNKHEPDNWDNGYYILPHVVLDAKHESSIVSCEQFGPIIPIISYDDEAQAREWANDCEYGLGASVWTADSDRGFEFARRLEAGSSFINTHSFDSLDPRMPFGGIKQSGSGREFGEAGLKEYVEEHSLRQQK